MANNYPFEPNHVSQVGNSAMSANEHNSSASGTPHTPSTPGQGQVASHGSSGGGSHPRRLASNTVLSGRYRIEHLIASGGMGAVYRAIDMRFNRPCAVKEMLDNFDNEAERAQSVEWFSREATLLLDLNHPCIPRVRDFFAEEGRHYLVMDFIEGQTLANVLEREGNVVGVNGARGVTEARARSWAKQICSVLNYLHNQSPPIIFRDMKPSNVMITNRDEVKLIDFGIARTFQSQRQATVIMTLGYAPPEQLHGMPEPRSDLYALGATIHRILTRHDAANNKPAIFSFPPVRTLRPDISPAFEQIIMKALAPNLDQRWSSAEEMERAIINLSPAPNAPSTTINTNISNSSAGHNISLPHSGPHQPISGPAIRNATHATTGPASSLILNALDHLRATPPRLDDAFNAANSAFQLEPQNALVHKIYGQIFARRQPPNVDNAIRAYNKSLELNFNDPETHKLLGDVWLYLRPNYVQAIPAYVQSIRLKDNDFETHERLGNCYEKTGQLQLAQRAYQEAIRQAPSIQQQPLVSPRLHFALGQVAKRLNNLPLAEHAFVQVLYANPSDHQTRFLLAQVYEQEAKLEEALREYGYVMNGPLRNDPRVSQLYYGLRQRLGR